MIKNIGLILVFAAAILTGFSLSERLNSKIKILKSIKSLLQQFKIQITYQMPTVTELFSQNSDDSISQMTENISQSLKNGFTFEESVSKGVEESKCLFVLSNEERNFIINTFSEIGTSDTDGQISLLENAIEKIDFYIENAIENKRKNSKVYMTVSIYAGLALVIILL